MFDIVKTSSEQEIRSGMTDIIGSGEYGKVYKHKIPGIVVKEVPEYRSDGWVIYALWSMLHVRPWTPRIHYLSVDDASGTMLAVMEELTPQSGNLGKGNHYKPEFIEANAPGFMLFKKFMDRHMNGYYHLDAHSGNWMNRGEQLILTDPIYVSNNKAYKQVVSLTKTMITRSKKLQGKAVLTQQGKA